MFRSKLKGCHSKYRLLGLLSLKKNRRHRHAESAHPRCIKRFLVEVDCGLLNSYKKLVMKQKFLQLLSIGMLLSSPAAWSQTIKDTYPGCISKEYLSAATSADSLMQLITSGKCTLVQKGTAFVMLDQGFMTSKILYKNLTLYVPSEAIR